MDGIVRAPHQHKHTDADPASLDETEARQGDRNPTNLRVVIIGLVLAVVAGIAIGAAYYVPDRSAVPTSGATPQPR